MPELEGAVPAEASGSQGGDEYYDGDDDNDDGGGDDGDDTDDDDDDGGGDETLNFLMTGQSFSVPRRAEGEEGSQRNLEEGEMEGGAVRTSPIFSIFVYFDNDIFQIFFSTFPSLP